MEEGGERCALTAGGEVGGAEVRDDRNAESFGDPGGFTDLPGGTGAAGLVKDGLAVQPDGIHGFAAKSAGDGVCVEAAQVMVKLAAFPGLGFAPGGGMKPERERLWKRAGPHPDQLDAPGSAGAEGAVDGVDTGAGHHADDAQGEVHRRFEDWGGVVGFNRKTGRPADQCPAATQRSDET